MAVAIFFVFISLSLRLVAAFYPVEIPSVVSTHSQSTDANGCLPKEEIAADIDNIRTAISDALRDIYANPNCGDGLWQRVAFLNMSEPTQQCPPAWSEYTSDGIRTCRRPDSTVGSCPSVVYNITHQYSRVCGRVVGYQFGSPCAFYAFEGGSGVRIARGTSLDHVWSYVAGANEQGACDIVRCPCSGGPNPPQSVGNNYYCESAYVGPECYVLDTFFSNDALWDGEDCNNEGTCCTGNATSTPGPPWFRVELTEPTSDDIEVSICHSQSTSDEGTPIELLELFVS